MSGRVTYMYRPRLLCGYDTSTCAIRLRLLYVYDRIHLRLRYGYDAIRLRVQYVYVCDTATMHGQTGLRADKCGGIAVTVTAPACRAEDCRDVLSEGFSGTYSAEDSRDRRQGCRGKAI